MHHLFLPSFSANVTTTTDRHPLPTAPLPSKRLITLARLTLVLLSLCYTAAQAQVSGTVFRDYNGDGLKATTEGGVAGVTVTAYFNATLVTTVSNATGAYSFPVAQLPNTTPVRLEFSGFPAGDFSGPFSAAAGGSGTSVQFVTAGTTTGANVNFGVNLPNEYCQPNPQLATTCYVNGDINSTAPTDAFVVWNYNDSGTSTANKRTVASKAQIGSAWGTAYNRTNRLLYTAAFLKRHVGIGPGGLGSIYVSNPNSGAANATLFVTIPNVGSIGTNASRGLGASSGLNADPTAFSLVGSAGLGDLDVSDDGTLLYVTNLNDKRIYIVNIATQTILTSVAIPDPGCTGGTYRPFALAYRQGQVYVGVTCDASTSLNRANLRASVYVMNATTNTFSPTPVLQTNLNYRRSPAWNEPFYANNGQLDVVEHSRYWYPWVNTYNRTALGAVFQGSSNVDAISHPTPLLSDIEFDVDGSMILGFIDRTSHQIGAANYQPTGNTTNNLQENNISGGDILRATPSGSTWTIEPLNYTTTGTPLEFYDGEAFPTVHQETAQGGLALVAGRGEVVTVAMDPTEFNTGGVIKLSNTTGDQTGNFQLYSGGLPFFAKASGLGDVQALCNLAPIEIGNRVFRDNNRNGIQDPQEAGIPNVVVRLFSNNVQVASATTNADGEYYFSSGAGTNTTAAIYNITSLTPGSTVQLRIDQGQTALSGLLLSPANQGANDAIDSDFTPSAVGSTTAVANVTLGVVGDNNHSFDFGSAACSLSVTVAATSTTYTVGQSVTLSAQVSPAGSYTYVWSGPAGVIITPTNAATVTATGLPVGVSSFTVVAISDPACSASAVVSVSVFNVPCTTGLGGIVFNDFESDGVNSNTATTGIAGVQVSAYDCQGNLLGTATTDANGRYNFTGATFSTAANYPIRVEFANLPAGFRPTANGTDGRTDVQFVPAPNCTVDFGAIRQSDYCQTNPDIVTTCFVAATLPNDPAILSFKPAEVNDPARPFVNQSTSQFIHHPAMTKRGLATQAQVGTINGLVYHSTGQTLFAAAFARVGSPLPNGLGAIYRILNPTNSTPTTSLLLTVANVGTGAVAQGDVGKKGLSNLELSANQQTLYTINLNTRALVSIPLVGTALTPGTVTETPIPAPADCAADYRPFAVRQHNGKLYIGVTCGAALEANLKGYVYEYDGTTFTQRLVIPFTYERANAVANWYGYPGFPEYISNNHNFVDWNTFPNLGVEGSGAVAKTQPWLTDIAFDGEDMILGVRSRLSDAVNGSFWVVGGDILRACQTTPGAWALENNGVCNGKTTQNPPPISDPYTGADRTRVNSKGPGGYEYYWGDDGFEGEAAQGSLLQIPGYPHVYVSQVDAIGHAGQVGVMALNNTTGRVDAAGNVFFGAPSGGIGAVPNGIGKSNGLGAISALCNPLPVEIGNRVWIDRNQNGVQDPCATEPGVAGIAVNLYDNAGRLVGKTTTNATGEYYFGPGNVATQGVSPTTGAPLSGTYTGPSPQTQYCIVFGNDGATPQFSATTGAFSLSGISYALTIPNSTTSNGNDQNDSDATIASGSSVTATNGFPTICLTTPDAGANHTFDLGLIPCIPPSLTVLASSGTVCQGSALTLTAQVSPVGSYTYSVRGPAGVTLSSTTSATVVATGLAVGLNTFTVTVGSSPTCFTTATVSVTVVAPPSITLTSATVCAGQPVSLTASGGGAGATYVFSATGAVGNILTVSSTVSITYSVTATTSGGCTATATATVTVNPLPVVTLTQTATVCVGQPVTLTATGGTSYSFSTGAINTTGLLTFTPTSTTTISVTVATASGCVSTTTATVTVDPLPVATLTPAIICAGETATLTATGGTSYTFSTGEINLTGELVFTPISTTTISVTVASASGCLSTTTATVTVNPLPTLITSVSCVGITTYTVSFTATPGAVVTTSAGTIIDNTVVGVPSGQPVALTATLNGCSVSVQLNQNCLSNAAGLGDYVFEDRNRDGTQDASEPAIPNVTVILYVNGVASATTTTNASGLYSFTGLTPGSSTSYAVGFTTPANYTATGANLGGDDTEDSDAIPATGLTQSVTLANGEFNPTLDAGFYLIPAQLGDFVFEDTNRNGQQDGGEAGIPNVIVTLLSSGTVVDAVATDGSGLYSFTGLTPGVPYSVSFTAPGGYSATVPNVGPDATDSDGDPVTGLTGVYSLTAGENNPTVDMGYYLPALGSLGNFVWNDLNNNGQQDANEPGVNGVRLTLLVETSPGQFSAVSSVLTQPVGTQAGVYSFTGLATGNYRVALDLTTIPTGFFISPDANRTGVPDDLDSDFGGATGLSPVVTINTGLPTGDVGRDNPTLDAAITNQCPPVPCVPFVIRRTQ